MCEALAAFWVKRSRGMRRPACPFRHAAGAQQREWASLAIGLRGQRSAAPEGPGTSSRPQSTMTMYDCVLTDAGCWKEAVTHLLSAVSTRLSMPRAEKKHKSVLGHGALLFQGCILWL